MAFLQPRLQYSQRRPKSGSEELYLQPSVSQPPQRQHQGKQPSDSQEWILFKPSTEDTTESLQNASSFRTLTVGCSQISDFGSLETGVWSYNEDEAFDENYGDDEELYSLDSHLPESRNEPGAQSSLGPGPSGTILPTHDGLGSFKLDRTVADNETQQHLNNCEGFNPQRVKMEKERVNTDLLEQDAGQTPKAELLRRIELWRLEQSNVLNQIQAESLQQSLRIQRIRGKSNKEGLLQETLASLSDSGIKATPEVKESLLNRITRKFIRDLIGIDDNLLPILFGESLACDIEPPRTPDHQPAPNENFDNKTWELKFFERIAYEIGILANKNSAHPTQLNNYLNSPNISLSYAGIPMIPETEESQRVIPDDVMFEPFITSRLLESQFKPTTGTQAQINLNSTTSIASRSTDEGQIKVRVGKSNRRELTREEWERDLDLKLVFRYICDRVATKFSSSSPPAFTPSSSKKHPAVSTMNSGSRAAIVGQCHPLITRRRKEKQQPHSSRTWGVSIPVGSVADGDDSPQALDVTFSAPMNNHHLGKNCRAGDREKTITLSGSSRNYWDWAESVGSGKKTFGAGPMGSWGEV